MDRNMGDLIAERRKELGMTQKELADKLNITDKAVSKWERNLACPDISTVPKLAEILGVRVEDLLNVTGKPQQEGTTGRMEQIMDLVLKAVPLAMGIALIVTSALKKDLDVYTMAGFAGIGLFAISLNQIRNK